ncbi:MAG: DUF4399 domain-containing protein [Mariprofundaceae bacterium]|nr:DUF4399 domain-containing protein [Mariprofundaceae bacterium]
MSKIFSVVIMAMMFAGTGWAHEGAKHGVHFVSPLDNAVYQGDIHVVMAVDGMRVEKAGQLEKESGHFHVIIDGGFVPDGEAVVKNATYMHFGKGQTEATLKLPKGNHTLTLQFADGHHISYGKAWSQTIHVDVK